MFADSIKHTNGMHDARPNALRDLRRDWQRWTIGERIAIVAASSVTLALLSLVH